MDKPKNLTGLWKRTSQKGTDYLSAIVDRKDLVEILSFDVRTDQISIMAFKNTKRPGKKDPDWNLSVSEIGERRAAEAPLPADPDGPPADDIPF